VTKSERIKWAKRVVIMNERRNEYRIPWEKPKIKRALMHKWWIIIKWIFKKDDRDANWNDLALDRNKWKPVVKRVMDLNFP
jgi:hypothetical protein